MAVSFALEDKFALQLFTWLAPIACGLLVVPPVLAAATLATTSDLFSQPYFTFPEPPFLEALRQFVFGFRSLPADIAAMVVQVAPAFLVAVAFKAAGTKALTRVGRIILVIFLVGILTSLFVVSVLSPDEMGPDFIGGKDALHQMLSSCKTILNACVTYVALLVGIRWPTSKTPMEDSG